jgi:hypothetical protein
VTSFAALAATQATRLALGSNTIKSSLHEVSISLLQRVNGAEVGCSEQCRWRLEALGMVPEAHWRLDLANAH